MKQKIFNFEQNMQSVCKKCKVLGSQDELILGMGSCSKLKDIFAVQILNHRLQNI